MIETRIEQGSDIGNAQHSGFINVLIGCDGQGRQHVCDRHFKSVSDRAPLLIIHCHRHGVGAVISEGMSTVH